MAIPGSYDPKILQVPYRDEADLLFYHPVSDSGSYRDVGKELLCSWLKVPDVYNSFATSLGDTTFCRPSIPPNGDYTVALLHAAFCNSKCQNDHYFGTAFEDIRTKFEDRYHWWWIYNRNIWTSTGVYVVDDLQLKATSDSFDLAELDEILKNGYELKAVRFSKDAKVRFAPKGTYKLGDHTPNSLVEDGFVIASFGVKGAERVGEISAKFPHCNIVVSGFETDVPEQSVSNLRTLHVDIDEEGLRDERHTFALHGGSTEGGSGGYASAVLGYRRR